MNKGTILFLVVLLTSVTYSKAQKPRSNPIVSHVFTADASLELFIAGQSFEYSVQNIGKKPKAKLSPLAINYKIFVISKVDLKPGRYSLIIKAKKDK